MKRGKSIRNILLAIAGCIILGAGCVAFTPAPADPRALNMPLAESLIRAPLVTIQFVSVNGAQIPEEALNLAVADLEELISGKVNRLQEASVTLELDESGWLTEEQEDALLLQFAPEESPENAILVVVAPAFASFGAKGDVKGLFDSENISLEGERGPYFIMFSTRRMEKMVRVPLAFDRIDGWRYVTIHELCHALGIPSSKSHSWEEQHCTKPGCVLYPPYGFRFWARSLLRGGVSYRPCNACLGEIAAIRDGGTPYTGKFNDWGDQLVAMNPGAADAYWMRVFRNGRQKDYAAAVADCSVIIELEPGNAHAYYVRGASYQNMEEPEKAIQDLEHALELKDNHKRALKTLAWILATSAGADFRDGPRAVKLATQACQISEWKVPSDLDTLACAYAESGDFDSARKYQRQAVELSSGALREELEERLQRFEQGTPYRMPRREAGSTESLPTP